VAGANWDYSSRENQDSGGNEILLAYQREEEASFAHASVKVNICVCIYMFMDVCVNVYMCVYVRMVN
jgi:hypothetical protein